VERLHRPPTCGWWYPDDAVELRELLASAFEASRKRAATELAGGAVAFVVPHAAPAYSGVVAAAAYRAIFARQPDCAIIAGFSHSREMAGIATPDIDAFFTPLGAVGVHTELARELSSHPPFHMASEKQVCDHSVEIQLPYLRYAVEHVRVLPLYVGRLNPIERQSAARRIAHLLEGNVVLIASSDFTHFGRGFGFLPFPPDEHAPERVRDLDHRVIAAAATLDESRFFQTLQDTGATVCGAAPIALLLAAIRNLAGMNAQRELDYQISAELTGDFRESVSYAALAYVNFAQRA